MNIKSFLYFSLILTCFLYLFSCSNDEDSSNKEEVNIEEIPDYSAGKKIYSSYCLTCHQENGEGIPGAFPQLTEKEADLYSVANGVEGSVMIAFKDTLNDQQITDVINYINHSWGNKFDDININTVSEIK